MIVIEEEEEEEEPFPFTQEAARDMTLEIQAMQDMLDADAWAPGAMPDIYLIFQMLKKQIFSTIPISGDRTIVLALVTFLEY